MNRRLFSCLLVLFLIALIMVIPTQYIPFGHTNDKLFHGLIFFSFTLFIRWNLMLKINILIPLMIGLAGLSELAQALFPYRSSSWEDMQANTLGIVLALVVIALSKQLKLISAGR